MPNSTDGSYPEWRPAHRVEAARECIERREPIMESTPQPDCVSCRTAVPLQEWIDRGGVCRHCDAVIRLHEAVRRWNEHVAARSPK